MRYRAAAWVLLIFAQLGCGHSARNFNPAPDAGAGTGGGNSGGAAGQGEALGGSSGSSAGLGGSSSDQGEAGMAGMVELPPDLCLGKICDTPPMDDCASGVEFQSYDKIGSCAAGVCSYVPHRIACTCQAHACTMDPCIGVTCNMPPAPICKDANTLTKHASAGAMCNAGSCSYPAANSTCAFGCANGACKADPCAAVTCNMPPSAACKDALTQTTYAASGTCAAGSCKYTATNAACGSNRRCTGTSCAECASDSSCGASCTACSGGTPKCKNLGTTSQCVACLSNTDCSNGAKCDTATNTCVLTCTGSFPLLCGGCASWDFESGNQGWDLVASQNGGNGNQGLPFGASVFQSPNHALAIGYKNFSDPTSFDNYSIRVSHTLCPTGTDLRNRTTLTFTLYTDQIAYDPIGGENRIEVGADDGKATGAVVQDIMLPQPNTSVTVNADISSGDNTAVRSIYIDLTINGNTGLPGTVYIDNISLH